jgi:hypothetical protein
VLTSTERPNVDSAAAGDGDAFLKDLDRRYRVPLIMSRTARCGTRMPYQRRFY